MQVAIVSDIHANRHAFEAVLGDVDSTGAEETWCLGDLVGYGAEPDACVELTMEHCSVVLAGNHDLAAIGTLPIDEFSAGAAAAARWTTQTMSEANAETLRRLSPLDVDHEVGLFHASPRDPVWEYVLSTLLADLCLDAQRHRICLVGHSHVALAFARSVGSTASGELRVAGSTADISDGEWLLNPGSVGQPRDGDPRAAWLLLDLEAWRAEWRRVEYDVAGAQAAILAAGLPESLAERLEYGQ
jgi:diadenosine tetraphosphatase ApaH/serine/threonine PP2A family protein phosphatase